VSIAAHLTPDPATSPENPRTDAALALVDALADDMIDRWHRGECPQVEEYLARYPQLGDAPEAVLELLSEEIALRQERGQEPRIADLVRRFPQWAAEVRALLDCHQVLASGLGPAGNAAAGECLGEFNLLAEIGRGAFARVFLARQSSLADRLVVLKLGPRAGGEHLCLARLQHTHIVPLCSVHDFAARGLRGLCLPYFGGATLDQLLEELTLRPACPRTGRDLLEALCRLQARAPVTLPVEGQACRFLARATWVQAVCWLGACLADALHYAHERGLVHLDLKAGNVLLAADGQPMLLDFHLAHECLPAGAAPPARLGGTPGCMPPEQQAALQAVAEGRPLPAALDGRTDLHALGRLLCELLGGCPQGNEAEAVPAIRKRNPFVTRGLADLLGRCLAAEASERYATAADLAADLRRHLDDLPLRGVPNRSLAERWCKWRRRRPFTLPLVLLVLLGVAAGAILLLHFRRESDLAWEALRAGQDCLARQRPAEALVAFRHGAALAERLPWGAELRQRLRRQTEWAEAAGELHRCCEAVRPLYAVDNLPPAQARRVVAPCRRLWDKRDMIRACLDDVPEQALQEQVRADLLDLAILFAHLRVRQEEGQAMEARLEALAILAEAEELLGSSCVLFRERASHARALGLTDLARQAERQAAALAPASAWEHYALGRAYFLAGDLHAALGEMDRVLHEQPQALWPRFCKGCCAHRLGRHDDAVTAFSVCLAVAPNSASCAHNRGLAQAELGRLDRALRDQDRALRLDPSFAAARLSRGLLYHRLGRHEEALADLQRAQAAGLDTAALHCGLALVHLAREDRPAALASVQAALRRDPKCSQALELRRLLER
jgi:serine/threonine protein kinase/lipoprotein NlpI